MPRTPYTDRLIFALNENGGDTAAKTVVKIAAILGAAPVWDYSMLESIAELVNAALPTAPPVNTSSKAFLQIWEDVARELEQH